MKSCRDDLERSQMLMRPGCTVKRFKTMLWYNQDEITFEIAQDRLDRIS